jgi:hypothetical protein
MHIAAPVNIENASAVGRAVAVPTKMPPLFNARSGRPPALLPNQSRIQLEADEKHEEHEAQAGDLLERHDGRKQPLGKAGNEPAEDRGTKHDPGHDLANHRRLADPAREPAERARRDDDDRQIEQQEE